MLDYTSFSYKLYTWCRQYQFTELSLLLLIYQYKHCWVQTTHKHPYSQRTPCYRMRRNIFYMLKDIYFKSAAPPPCLFCLLKTTWLPPHSSKAHKAGRQGSKSVFFLWVKLPRSKTGFSSLTSIHKTPKSCNLLTLGVAEDPWDLTLNVCWSSYMAICVEQALGMSTNIKYWWFS